MFVCVKNYSMRSSLVYGSRVLPDEREKVWPDNVGLPGEYELPSLVLRVGGQETFARRQFYSFI